VGVVAGGIETGSNDTGGSETGGVNTGGLEVGGVEVPSIGANLGLPVGLDVRVPGVTVGWCVLFCPIYLKKISKTVDQ
jgi:hypothetical protein